MKDKLTKLGSEYFKVVLALRLDLVFPSVARFTSDSGALAVVFLVPRFGAGALTLTSASARGRFARGMLTSTVTL
jgi:hypothetical protein